MVGDGPTAVGDYFFVLQFTSGDAVAENWDGMLDELEFGKRAPSA